MREAKDEMPFSWPEKARRVNERESIRIRMFIVNRAYGILILAEMPRET